MNLLISINCRFTEPSFLDVISDLLVKHWQCKLQGITSGSLFQLGGQLEGAASEHRVLILLESCGLHDKTFTDT